MEPKSLRWLYVLLGLTWLSVAAWQYTAHLGARDSLRASLLHRAEDISRTIAVVIRAEGRFHAVPQDRLEAVLEELTASTGLRSVSLLDARANVAASAGPPTPVEVTGMADGQSWWLDDSVVVVSLVALGAPEDGRHSPRDGDGQRGRRGPDRDFRRFPPPRPGGPGPHGGPERGGRDGGPGPTIPPEAMAELERYMTGEPLTQEQVVEIVTRFPPHLMDSETRRLFVRGLNGKILTPELLADLQVLLRHREPRDRWRGGGPRWFDRDPAKLLDKRGIHAFVIELPSDEVYRAEARDFQMRLFVLLLLAMVCGVSVYLLRTLKRSASLGVRLARSEAMAAHLAELNMAAAGLVHETKNPLNLIRGLAQLIGRDVSGERDTHETAHRIVEEADRVTGRLNQFLDYSRPLQPRSEPVALAALVRDVLSLLESDREDKQLAFVVDVEDSLSVRADRELLRQVLFNLLLNGIEAVSGGGRIGVAAGRDCDGRGWLTITDDGPGVDPALKDTLFEPYVTGSDTGTGLGLTLVRQIALAHGWTVTAESAPEGGACFRISGMEVT